MIRCILIFCLACAAFTQTPQPATSASADAIKDARKLHNDGKFDEAIAAFAKIAAADPKNWEAHVGIGNALDLKGEYDNARKHFQQAIDVAPEDSRPNAWRALAMSYAFTRDTKNAEKYEKLVYDYRIAKNDLIAAAEVANEVARVLLESGDIDGADKWYRLGHETALKKADLSAQDRDLWEFRWESAQARVAARRGNKAEARKHADAANAVLTKGTNPEQAPYGPYVSGYVAYYAGDHKTAISDFLKTNQNDPFNLAMIAQAYERSGNKEKATEYWRKVLQSNAHNPTNAYARPLAKAKLKS